MIRVAMVDDQELVRAGILALLRSDPDLEVVGEADNGEAAIEMVRSTPTDVVLMDIRMPVMDGIEATAAIKAFAQPPAVVILTTFDTNEHVHDALLAGADGFLVKDTPPARLLDAVKAAAQGGVVLSPGTAARLRDQMVAATASSRLPDSADLKFLTPRETEVLGCIGRGLTNREIANELIISEATAKTHVSRILTKLNLNSRVHAVVLAYEIGLVTPGAGTRSTTGGVEQNHPPAG